MNMMTIEEAEYIAHAKTTILKELLRQCEHITLELELLKTQIASARIDGKKEFDADSYMKPKKEKK